MRRSLFVLALVVAALVAGYNLRAAFETQKQIVIEPTTGDALACLDLVELDLGVSPSVEARSAGIASIAAGTVDYVVLEALVWSNICTSAGILQAFGELICGAEDPPLSPDRVTVGSPRASFVCRDLESITTGPPFQVTVRCP